MAEVTAVRMENSQAMQKIKIPVVTFYISSLNAIIGVDQLISCVLCFVVTLAVEWRTCIARTSKGG